jgi:hypothetical protein
MLEHTTSATFEERGWRAAVAGQESIMIDTDPNVGELPSASSTSSFVDSTLTFEALFPDTDLNSLLTIEDSDLSGDTSPFTSPRQSTLGSPHSEVLLTPSSNTSPLVNSPIIDYLDTMGDLPLFGTEHTSAFSHTAKSAPSISPADTRLSIPVVDTYGSEVVTLPYPPRHSSVASMTATSDSESSGSPATRKRATSTKATGFRTNIALIPIDAPTQPRNYLGPSATSRKNLEAVAAAMAANGVTPGGRGRKRTRAAAGLKLEGDHGEGASGARTRSSEGVGEEDQLNSDSISPPSTQHRGAVDPDTVKASILEKLEDKRRKNALSARKSRMLKKETKEMLETEVDRLKSLLEDMTEERDYWKERAELNDSKEQG